MGAIIIMIDSTKDGLQMDYDAAEAAISERTKAIIPVSLGGVPCDCERLFFAAERKRHLFRPANPIQEAMGRGSPFARTPIGFSTDAAPPSGFFCLFSRKKHRIG